MSDIQEEVPGLSAEQIKVENLMTKASKASAELEMGHEIPESRIPIEKDLLPELFKKYEFDPINFSQESLVSVNDAKIENQRLIDVVWDIKGPKNVFLRRTVTYKEIPREEGRIFIERKAEWFLEFRNEEDFKQRQAEQAQSIGAFFAKHEQELSTYNFSKEEVEDLRRRYAPAGHEKDFSYLKVYPENFGDDVVEPMAMRGLQTLPFVESVEPATQQENQDRTRQVDFWVKIKGIEKPFGIQFTVGKEPGILKRKFDALVKNKREVVKTDFPDSKIKGAKEPLPVILVNADGLPYSRALRKWQEIEDYVPQIPFDGRLLYPAERLLIIKKLLENSKDHFPSLAKELTKVVASSKGATIPELARREVEPTPAA